MDKARKEIKTKDEYKYVVTNDDVNVAKEKIAQIIRENQQQRNLLKFLFYISKKELTNKIT